jgi:hypothetical protein
VHRHREQAKSHEKSIRGVALLFRILERAGLVRRRIEGRDHYLSLDPGPLDAAAAWMQREREAWSKPKPPTPRSKK